MYTIQCDKCNLHENGIHHPYIGSNAKYVIVGESPASAHWSLTPPDSKFWSIMAEHGFTQNEFAVIHSINCYNDNKPSEYHRDCCRPVVAKFIERVDPELVICSGNFALHTLFGRWGINNYVNTVDERVLFKKTRKIMYW